MAYDSCWSLYRFYPFSIFFITYLLADSYLAIKFFNFLGILLGF